MSQTGYPVVDAGMRQLAATASTCAGGSPSSRAFPGEHVHEPWRMGEGTQREAGCVIGRDYPAPIVDHAQERRVSIARYRDMTDP